MMQRWMWVVFVLVVGGLVTGCQLGPPSVPTPTVTVTETATVPVAETLAGGSDEGGMATFQARLTAAAATQRAGITVSGTVTAGINGGVSRATSTPSVTPITATGTVTETATATATPIPTRDSPFGVIPGVTPWPPPP